MKPGIGDIYVPSSNLIRYRKPMNETKAETDAHMSLFDIIRDL